MVVESCLCLTSFLNSLASRCKPDCRNLHACVASAAFGFGRCYVRMGGLRFSDIGSNHQRRRPQACVSVCQRGGRMRNSLGVRGARVYVLFVFVRSLGLLTALAALPCVLLCLLCCSELLGLSCRRSRGSRFVILAICVHLMFLVLLVLLV